MIPAQHVYASVFFTFTSGLLSCFSLLRCPALQSSHKLWIQSTRLWFIPRLSVVYAPKYLKISSQANNNKCPTITSPIFYLPSVNIDLFKETEGKRRWVFVALRFSFANSQVLQFLQTTVCDWFQQINFFYFLRVRVKCQLCFLCDLEIVHRQWQRFFLILTPIWLARQPSLMNINDFCIKS